jgi:hypothetical protein
LPQLGQAAGHLTKTRSIRTAPRYHRERRTSRPGGPAAHRAASLWYHTGAATEITGLPDEDILASRSLPAGFWMVMETSPESSLWEVDGTTGVTTQLGTYPEAPVDSNPLQIGVLDGWGHLYQKGRATGGVDVVVRRSITGISEVIDTEAGDPEVKMHGSSLITGP